eukprot:403353768
MQKPQANISEDYLTYQSFTKLFDSSNQSEWKSKVTGSSFYIKNSNQVTVQYSKFQNNYQAVGGGVFYLQNTSFSDSGQSTFMNNAAFEGGSIYCFDCNITLNHTQFVGDRSYRGGSIYLRDSSNATFINITVDNVNSTQRGGFLYINSSYELLDDSVINKISYNLQEEEQHLNLSPRDYQNDVQILGKSAFKDTRSGQFGGAIYVDNKLTNINLNGQIISENSFSSEAGGYIYINDAKNIQIKSSYFYNFASRYNGSFLFSSSSDVDIQVSNSNFDGWPYNQENYTDFIPGFDDNIQYQEYQYELLLNNSAAFTIKNSIQNISFYNNTYMNIRNRFNGGVFDISNSSLTDEKSQYLNNHAYSGTAIYTQNSKIILNDITFENNKCIDTCIVKWINLNQDQQIQRIKIKDSQSLGNGIQFTVSNTILTNQKQLNHKILFDDVEIIKTIENSKDIKLRTQNLIGKQASAIYLKNTSAVSIRNLQAQNCYGGSEQGGVLRSNYLSSPDCQDCYLNISNSNFRNNAAIIGGVMSLSGGSLIMKNNTFENSLAQEGGVLYLQNNVVASLEDITSQNSHSLNQGGFLSINSATISEAQTLHESQLEAYLNFTNIKIVNSSSDNIGGAFYVNRNQRPITMASTNSTQDFTITYFKNIKTSKEGSLFYSQESSAEDGGVIFAKSSQISLDGTIFRNNIAKQGGIMLLDNDGQVNLNNVTIQNNSALDLGGAIKITRSNQNNNQTMALQFQNCKNIQDLEASRGGFINVDNSLAQISIINSTLKDIYSQTYGGLINIVDAKNQKELQEYMMSIKSGNQRSSIFYIQEAISIFSKENQFQQCGYSSQAGLLTLDKTTFIDYGSQFSNIYGNLGGVILSSQSNLNITNSFFSNNQGQIGGVLYLSQNSILNIKNSSFVNNLATQYGGVLHLSTYSYFKADNCTFAQNIADEASVLDILGSNSESDVVLSNCKFFDNQAKKNTISIMQSSVLIQNSTFKNNYASSRSKNIFVGFSNLKIEDSQMFYDSQYLGSQDPDYSQGAFLSLIFEVNLIIANTQFINGSSQNGGALYIQGDSIIDIQNSTFTDNYAQLKGGAFYAAGFLQMSISYNSIIKNNIAFEIGDDIYITNTKNLFSLSQVDIENINAKTSIYIEQAQVNIRGALYLNNPEQLEISNCTFLNNAAISTALQNKIRSLDGSGGALYFTCNQNKQNCRLTITSDNVFENNTASLQGGAIYWDVLEPEFNPELVTFKNNSASLYGDNIASFSEKLGLISLQEYYFMLFKNNEIDEDYYLQMINQSENSRLLQEAQVAQNYSIITNQRSGGILPDIFLAHMDRYHQIVGTDFYSVLRVFVNSSYNQEPLANIYAPIIEGNNQFISFGGVILVHGVSFTASPGNNYSLIIETNGIDSTKSNINDQEQSSDFSILIDLRECELGEEFTSNGKCQICENSYSLLKLTNPGTCQACPQEKAFCFGGSNIGPRQGYWRKSNQTDVFIACLNKEACLGMIPPENNQIGSCVEGYQGILCADCQTGFSRSNEYHCSKCPNQALNVIRLSFILLGVIAIIVVLVRSTLNGAKEKNNVTNIFLRILFNHFQLVMTTSMLDFNCFDCFLDHRVLREGDQNQDQTSIRIFFQKLIIISVLPIIVLLIIISFWQFSKFIKSDKYVNGKTISTIVIVLFLIHPSIVQYMFLNFKCKDIDDEQRILTDLEVVCWDYQHKIFSYYLAIPSIIVWGLGIPFFALVLLIRIKKNLDHLRIRESFLIITTKKHPFSTISLNDLETLSLITSMITIYCGLFFIIDKPRQWIDQNPDYASGSISLTEDIRTGFFVIIIVSNVIFFIYWCLKMYEEVKAKFRQNLPVVYLWLCLCYNKRKLKSEIEDYNMKKEHQSHRDEFEKCLQNLQEDYNNGEFIINHHNIEKFQLLLSTQYMIQNCCAKNFKKGESIIHQIKQETRQKRQLQSKQNYMCIVKDQNQEDLLNSQILQDLQNSNQWASDDEENLQEVNKSFVNTENMSNTQREYLFKLNKNKSWKGDGILDIDNQLITLKTKKGRALLRQNNNANSTRQAERLLEQSRDTNDYSKYLSFKQQHQQDRKIQSNNLDFDSPIYRQIYPKDKSFSSYIKGSKFFFNGKNKEGQNNKDYTKLQILNSNYLDTTQQLEQLESPSQNNQHTRNEDNQSIDNDSQLELLITNLDNKLKKLHAKSTLKMDIIVKKRVDSSRRHLKQNKKSKSKHRSTDNTSIIRYNESLANIILQKKLSKQNEIKIEEENLITQAYINSQKNKDSNNVQKTSSKELSNEKCNSTSSNSIIRLQNELQQDPQDNQLHNINSGPKLEQKKSNNGQTNKLTGSEQSFQLQSINDDNLLEQHQLSSLSTLNNKSNRLKQGSFKSPKCMSQSPLNLYVDKDSKADFSFKKTVNYQDQKGTEKSYEQYTFKAKDRQSKILSNKIQINSHFQSLLIDNQDIIEEVSVDSELESFQVIRNQIKNKELNHENNQKIDKFQLNQVKNQTIKNLDIEKQYQEKQKTAVEKFDLDTDDEQNQIEQIKQCKINPIQEESKLEELIFKRNI